MGCLYIAMQMVLHLNALATSLSVWPNERTLAKVEEKSGARSINVDHGACRKSVGPK